LTTSARLSSLFKAASFSHHPYYRLFISLSRHFVKNEGNDYVEIFRGNHDFQISNRNTTFQLESNKKITEHYFQKMGTKRMS
jgi:hypothetical protein